MSHGKEFKVLSRVERLIPLPYHFHTLSQNEQKEKLQQKSRSLRGKWVSGSCGKEEGFKGMDFRGMVTMRPVVLSGYYSSQRGSETSIL